ncbi:MAG TPA: hypothetical protein VEY07_03345 [Thermoplasmata archaeon]|nr:hypothetical protein [Thermoplasmata archaeon]
MTSGSPPSAEPPAGAGRLSPRIVQGIEAHLRARELRREELHERARRLRRLSQSTMIRLLDGQAADSELEEIRGEMGQLAEWVKTQARGDETLAHDAFQEGVEASLLGAVLGHRPLPGPSDLGVDPEQYLLGLGDLAGELRRLVLGRLNDGDLAGADQFLALMDDVYRTLMRFDTTRAIVQLKPKQDTARALLERTRGEVTMAHLLSHAHARLEGT